jgi:hypothetical protein
VSFLDNWENLNIFTAGEFSDLAAVTSATAVETEISGIFDERYEPMFDQYGSTAEGRQITFLVQTAKTAGLHHGDRLTIKSKEYKVTEFNPIDDGKLTRILLLNL